MPNRFTPIQPGTDPNQQLAIINKNFAELDNEGIKKLFYDASGTPSIQIGVQQDGSSRIRIAQAGYDVTAAPDSNIAFDSSRLTFQIVGKPLTVDFSLTTGTTASATTVTIFHNLGYIPLTENSVTVTSNTFAPAQTGVFPVPYFTLVTGSGSLSNVFVMNAYVTVRKVTTTSITYEIGMQGGSFTIAGTITCYIKQVPAIS